MTNAHIEWGDGELQVRVPASADILTLPEAMPLPRPAEAVARALANPLGTPPLDDIVARAMGRVDRPRAVVVVSDTTRPVPYRGQAGILEPVLATLRAACDVDIEILVATGTHRALTAAELHTMLCESAFAPDVTITCHDSRRAENLCYLGTTPHGTEAWVNRHYVAADIKILTGLVEPHFMAGYSGGRKSICPGLVGEKVTHEFHGAHLTADPDSDSLVLDRNPCHREATAVAQMAGADFVVNVTLDREKHLTGVFAGGMEAVFQSAVTTAAATCTIPIEREYDVVVTHAGFVGINHYQAAKAGVEGAKAVRPGGTLILAANHTDIDPVGGPNYRTLLPMLRELSPDAIDARLTSPDWDFIAEQWELQMWGRVIRKLGDHRRLVYCSPQLTGQAFAEGGLFGTDGGTLLAQTACEERSLAEAMVQAAIERSLAAGPDTRVAVLVDGPYGVPVVTG